MISYSVEYKRNKENQSEFFPEINRWREYYCTDSLSDSEAQLYRLKELFTRRDGIDMYMYRILKHDSTEVLLVDNGN